MRNNSVNIFKTTSLALALGLFCTSAVIPVANAESLFRTGIAYQANQTFTPRSLFSAPRAATIGDMVTININETTTTSVQNNSSLENKQSVTENSTTILSTVIQRLTNIKDLIPSVTGVDNDNKTDITGNTGKTYTFQDVITCQVVQVLPNGNLIVQGKKTIFANKETQDLYVSGIVNPYYLDLNNSVASTQVANLQMNLVGRGVVSREQGNGVINKYFQFFN